MLKSIPATSYSPDWFRERAFHALRKMEEGVWDYSDSLLLYTPSGEEQYESIQQGEDPYVKLITEPENKYLQSIASAVVAGLPDVFEYIDLGPGTAHKEQFIFDELKKQGKKCVYRPVDISEHYLSLAVEQVSPQGISVGPLQASFEELPERLGTPMIPRFVSLGLTFGNYFPQDILTLLKAIAGKGGAIFIDVHQRDRARMEDYVELYTGIAFGLTDPKLQLLGLDPKKAVTKRIITDGIQCWYTLRTSTPELEQRGVKSGDRLLMMQSLRQTKDTLETELVASGVAYTLFDTGSPFLGALLKT